MKIYKCDKTACAGRYKFRPTTCGKECKWTTKKECSADGVQYEVDEKGEIRRAERRKRK